MIIYLYSGERVFCTAVSHITGVGPVASVPRASGTVCTLIACPVVKSRTSTAPRVLLDIIESGNTTMVLNKIRRCAGLPFASAFAGCDVRFGQCANNLLPGLLSPMGIAAH